LLQCPPNALHVVWWGQGQVFLHVFHGFSICLLQPTEVVPVAFRTLGLLGEEVTIGGREGARDEGRKRWVEVRISTQGGKEGRREGGEGGRAYLNSSRSSSQAVRISFLYRY